MENKYSNILWNISNAYRGVMMTEALTPAVVRLVFIKYVTDNYIYADSKEEMLNYANVQKYIASKDVDGLVNAIMPVLESIDKKIEANGILTNAFASYSNDLLGGFNKKKAFSNETSERIISVLGSIDLTEDDENKGLLFDALTEFVSDSLSRSGRYGAVNTTSDSMTRLVKSILEVNEDDTFMDFACGYGLSSFDITQGRGTHLYLSDINEECVQMAVMLSIIHGELAEKTFFSNENVFDKLETNTLVSKAFIDFPLSYKVDRQKYGYSDGTILAAHRLIDSLKEGGRGIMTCASNLLFKTNKETNEFRKYLLENHFLEAVVTLPPIVPGVSVNINILVLSKTDNKDVVFIDTRSNDIIQFSNNARNVNTELLDPGISKIAEVIKNKEELLGVSTFVGVEEIIKKNTLVPQAFIVYPKTSNSLSSQELNKKINTLYDQLFKAHKEF